MRAIEQTEALSILGQGAPLVGCRIVGELNLRAIATSDEVAVPVVLRDCELNSICGHYLQFRAPVELVNVRCDGDVDFQATYFFAGFSAKSCQIGGTMDFLAGGHNLDGAAFTLRDCSFSGYVNFLDCWFEGPVAISGCSFAAGSNLVGNRGEPYVVQFDVDPVLAGNDGAINLNGDADGEVG